jgi:hypothetical protein
MYRSELKLYYSEASTRIAQARDCELEKGTMRGAAIRNRNRDNTHFHNLTQAGCGWRRVANQSAFAKLYYCQLLRIVSMRFSLYSVAIQINRAHGPRFVTIIAAIERSY